MIALSCQNCGAKLEISDDLEVFACKHCGMNYRVERAGGTVALTRLEEQLEAVSASANRQAAELALVRLKGELAEIEPKLAQAQSAIREARGQVEHERGIGTSHFQYGIR